MNFSYKDIKSKYPYMLNKSWWNSDFEKYIKKLSMNNINIATHIAKKWYFQKLGVNQGIKNPEGNKEHWGTEIIDWIDLHEYEYPKGAQAGEGIAVSEYDILNIPYKDRGDLYKLFDLLLYLDFNTFCSEIKQNLSMKKGYPFCTFTNLNKLYQVYNYFSKFLAECLIQNTTNLLTDKGVTKFVLDFKNDKKLKNISNYETKFKSYMMSELLAAKYEESYNNLLDLNFSINDYILVDTAYEWYTSYINGKSNFKFLK